MHHPYRLKEFAKEYIEEGYVSDMPYQWTIASDETENVKIHNKNGLYTIIINNKYYNLKIYTVCNCIKKSQASPKCAYSL